VSGEVPLVGTYPLTRDDADARLQLDDLVDEEERLSVRKDRLDCGAIKERLSFHERA